MCLIQLGGIALAVIGAIILVGPSELSFSSDRTVGIIVFLLQSVWIGLFFVFQKRYLSEYSPLTVTTGLYMSGAPFILLTALVFVPESKDWIPNTGGMGAVAYAVLAHSIVGYMILSFANRHTQSSIVAAMNCLQTPLTAIFASIFAGETFDLTDVLGSLVIVCGLGLITYQRYKEQQEQRLADELSARQEAEVAAEVPKEVPPLQVGSAEKKKIRVVVVKGEDGDDDEMVELEDAAVESEPSSPTIVPAT